MKCLLTKLRCGIFQIFYLSTLYVFFIGAASANPLNCLEEAKYEVLHWNKSWAKDNFDNNALYRINSTRSYKRKGKLSVEMELVAIDSTSKKSLRHILVQNSKIAKQICSSIKRGSADRRSITKSTSFSTVSRRSRKQLRQAIPTGRKRVEKRAKHPYIHHTNTGWIRTNPPEKGNFATCKVLGKAFSCLEKHKSQFAYKLKQIEKEIRATSGI